jgi:peptidoglycan/LPS O-acetylase OafA/YrhL
VTMVMTVGFATISYRIVEQPGSRLVRRAAAYIAGSSFPARVRQN